MQLLVAEFEVLFLHFPRETEEKVTKKYLYRWPVDQYLNMGPPNHEAGVLFSSATGVVVTRTLQRTLS